MRKTESFEKFYFRNVGLGEACGCAEKIIDAHEFERQASVGVRRPKTWVGIATALRRFGILPRLRG